MAEPEFDLDSLRAAYEAGADPAAIIAGVYDRIAAAGDPGIFISLVERETAVAAAQALGRFDPARPLWGVPFAVKDNIDVAGLATTAACPDFAYMPQASAPVVDRLLAAGAILIGKTNLDQFATGLVGVRTPWPVPRNALDPALVPGGSSSGSAVAVARGLVGFALGTDTAGSGRVPAALNGIVGLKPTVGVVSTRGVVPACRTLDCVSVFAGTVPEAWAVFSVIAGYDPAEPYSRAVPLSRPALPPVVRAGVPDAASRRFGSGTAEAAFDAALPALGAVAGAPSPVDLAPFFEAAALLYGGAYVAERLAAIRPFYEASPDALLPVTRQIIRMAEDYSAADAFRDRYRLEELRRQTAAVWDRIDVLVVPSIPDVCTLEEIAREPVGANVRLGLYTNFVNLLDLCALAVPGPARSDGRPSGITLIAPAGRDALLAALGERLHAAAGVAVGATGRAVPQPRQAPAAPPPGTIEVAVVGAHLSGLPLNGQLTRRGATFLRAVKTKPAYRLYALPGGPPERPGLVRVASGGAAIEAEVWALPPDGFGSFVAEIPSPLGIGKVALADGTIVPGFLCEGVAVAGARDITGLGGWRGYLAERQPA